MEEPWSGISGKGSCARERRPAVGGTLLRYFLLLLPAFLCLALGGVPASAQSAAPHGQQVTAPGLAAPRRQAASTSQTSRRLRASAPSKKTYESPQGQVLYDNGLYNGTVNAWTINSGFSVSDSFAVPSNSNIEDLHFVYWDSSTTDLLTTVDMAIGSTSFGGTPQMLTGVTNTVLNGGNPNQHGYYLFEASYNFANIPWSGDGYITLSNACTATSGCSPDGPPIEWDENSGPSTAYDSSLGSIPSEAFTMTGSTGGIPTTTTVTSSQNPSQFDQPVTFTATVTSNDGNPTGTVDFTDNGQTLPGCGEVTLMPQQNGSTATCQTSDLTVGSHPISATYGGNQNFNGSSGSLMQLVEASPTCGSLTLQTTGVPFVISASVTCTDPQGEALATTIDWGDKTSTTVNGDSGELLVVPKPAPYPAKSNFYVVTVTSKDSPSGLSSVPVTSSVSFSESQAVFAGQSATVTATVQVLQAGTVTFECQTVTDSSGVVRQASDLGITCSSQPSPIMLSGGLQSVTFVIQTTGRASASLVPRAKHRPWFYAFWLWPAVLGAAVGGTRTRRQRMLKCVALIAVIAMLLIFTFCGGGFTPPSGGGTSTPTPAGSYQVTVVGPTGFGQWSLIVPLTVTGP